MINKGLKRHTKNQDQAIDTRVILVKMFRRRVFSVGKVRNLQFSYTEVIKDRETCDERFVTDTLIEK